MADITTPLSIEYNEAAEGTVFDIDRFAVHDGPGIRVAIFLKGCPLRCQWCHSPESVSRQSQLMFHVSKCILCGVCTGVCLHAAQSLENDQRMVLWDQCQNCGTCATACPSQALVMAGSKTSVRDLLDIISRNLVFLRNSGGGVTLSGGEPLYQPQFAFNLLKACRSIQAHTAIETTGFASEATVEAIAPFVDLFLYDIKHMDPIQHRILTGVDNRPIHRNLRRLVELGKDIQIRVPLIPGCNDDNQNIEATYRLATALGISKLALLPYNVAAGSKYEWIGRPYSMDTPVLQSEERLAALKRLGDNLGLVVQIGG